MEKIEYYICLFLFALRKKESVLRNTLFRYVYIYHVTNEYLGNKAVFGTEFVFDKELGLANVSELTRALQEVNRKGYITINGQELVINRELVLAVNGMLERADKVKEDLNNITYFVDIVSLYNEDVVLAIFFNEPNVDAAISRGKEEISLHNNRLKALLEEFEKVANEECNKSLEKYDVFTSWLDYVFEIYLQGKSVDEN